MLRHVHIDDRACGAPKACRRRSGNVLVFVYESVAPAGSKHREGCWGSVWRLVDWCRWSLAQRLVWSVLVVVSDVADGEPFELSTVPDDGAGQPSGLLEEFSSDRSDPALGEGVGHRSPHGGLEYLHALGLEDLVEAVGELVAAITHQSPGVFESLAVADEEVAGGLGGPLPGGVGGDTGEEDFTGLDVDEEQDLVAVQECGVDSEEVARNRDLGGQELGPCHLGSSRGGVDAVVGEDLPDGGLGGRVSEPGDFALDGAVSSDRVLGGESHDQLAQFHSCGRPTGSAGLRLGPVFGDTTMVPAQQRLGCDDPAVLCRFGERCGDGSEQGPVVVVDRWAIGLASQNLELVAQHDDLEVLRAAGARRELCQQGEEPVEDAKHEDPGCAASCLVSTHDRVLGTHTPPNRRKGQGFGGISGCAVWDA